MAGLTAKLTELSQFIGWEVEPLHLLTWVQSKLPYLPEEIKKDTEEYFTTENFNGDYFRVERGRAAFYALRRQEVLNMTYREEIKQCAEDYYRRWSKSKDPTVIAKAFHLMEFAAWEAEGQEEITKNSIKAARYGLEAHEWEATLKVAMHPFTRGFVGGSDEKELQYLAGIARKEIKHEEKFGG